MDVERAIELMDGAYTAVDESVIIPGAGYRLTGIIKTSLREQQEREKGCQFCTGRPGELKRTAGHKYCYMCGRRLKEAQEDGR